MFALQKNEFLWNNKWFDFLTRLSAPSLAYIWSGLITISKLKNRIPTRKSNIPSLKIR